MVTLVFTYMREDTMPFRSKDYIGSYTPEQLDMLQNMYNEVCAILDECPTTGEKREIIAKAVIRLTEQGDKDPIQIAHTIKLLAPIMY